MSRASIKLPAPILRVVQGGIFFVDAHRNRGIMKTYLARSANMLGVPELFGVITLYMGHKLSMKKVIKEASKGLPDRKFITPEEPELWTVHISHLDVPRRLLRGFVDEYKIENLEVQKPRSGKSRSRPSEPGSTSRPISKPVSNRPKQDIPAKEPRTSRFADVFREVEADGRLAEIKGFAVAIVELTELTSEEASLRLAERNLDEALAIKLKASKIKVRRRMK